MDSPNADHARSAVHPSSPPGLPIGQAYPWLAPLAGYSTLPFRLLCREFGAKVACTEMVSAKGLVLGQGRKSDATNELLATWPALDAPVRRGAISPLYPGPDPSMLPVPQDMPLVVQLFGAEASFMEEAVRILVDRGYTWFDCNMGCSVPKVVKSGAGAAMLEDPDNAVAVAAAMVRAAGGGRVGFKLRLGRAAGEDVYLPLARRLEEAGAGWLVLHPRYARQKFTGTADWAAVRPLVAQSGIPVIVSGDLFTAEDGLNALAATGAAGVMFARGAMHDPLIFRRFTTLFSQGVSQEASAGDCEARVSDLEYCIRRHMALGRAFTPHRLNRQGIESSLLAMRAFVPRYVTKCAGARHLRRALAGCATWEAMDDLLDDFFSKSENLAEERSLL